MDQSTGYIPRPNPDSKCHTIAVVTYRRWREAATSMVQGSSDRRVCSQCRATILKLLILRAPHARSFSS